MEFDAAYTKSQKKLEYNILRTTSFLCGLISYQCYFESTSSQSWDRQPSIGQLEAGLLDRTRQTLSI